MSRLRSASLIGLLAGVALLVYGAIQGNVSIHLVLVIPVITGTGPWVALGGLLLVAGLAGYLFTSTDRLDPSAARASFQQEPPTDTRTEASTTESGGFLLLGPLPIVWGSSRRMLWALALLGAVLSLFAIALVSRL